MEAKELRIGNLVTIDNPKHHSEMKNIPLGVSGIGSNMNSKGEFEYTVRLSGEATCNYNPTFNQFISFIQPIPLTEEWLVKFGFEDKRGLFIRKHDNGLIGVSVRDGSTGLYNSEGAYVIGSGLNMGSVRTMYVHQLQNLYFALTGEELTM